jgi:6-pyruvoyltetrahydropterin/6-carboxytetrahydropterin synthase
MYEIGIKTHFSAAHRLVGYQGCCANQHGHNWGVEVYISGTVLDELGMLIDFTEVKDTVGAVMELVDHKDLNALDEFSEKNPTSERIAEYLYHYLAEKFDTDDHRVSRIIVRETPNTQVTYLRSEK